MEIHAITDGKKTTSELMDIILSIEEYVDYIHIREKNKSAKEIIDLIDQLLQNNCPKEKLIINDRLDVAFMTNLSHVHLPQSSLPVQRVKNRFPQMCVGVSVHSLEEAKRAEQEGAQYVLFGHIFETDSKKGVEPRGITALKQVVESVSIPVVAIGGITLKNVQEVIKAGASGIAVMSYLFSSPHPQDAAKALKDSMKGMEKR